MWPRSTEEIEEHECEGKSMNKDRVYEEGMKFASECEETAMMMAHFQEIKGGIYEGVRMKVMKDGYENEVGSTGSTERYEDEVETKDRDDDEKNVVLELCGGMARKKGRRRVETKAENGIGAYLDARHGRVEGEVLRSIGGGEGRLLLHPKE